MLPPLCVIATLLNCNDGVPPVRPMSHPSYITIGEDALDAVSEAQGGAPPDILERHAGVAVVRIPEEDIPRLAEAIHGEFDHCGGFIAHDSFVDAEAALSLQIDARPDPGYTIDRAAAVRAVLPALDAVRIRDTIRELSAMQNRYYQSTTGAAASLWLRDRWRSLTPRSDVTVELVDHGYAQMSVVMTIPGATRPDEIVVIGGHLDSIAAGGAASRAPGADDDASGIATITEIARALLAADYRPARTVQFMAYAAEEVGLRGSQRIARDYQSRGVRVVGALQLDMTNFQGSDKDIWLMKDFTSAAQNAFLTALIDTYVGATWGMDACGYACSDHASWYRTGVPASMPFESRSRDRNRKIHTDRDTLELSGDNAAHAVKFARLGVAYAIELAKGELGDGARLASAALPTGEPGHPGAALAIAVLVLAAWVGRAAVRAS